MSAHESAIDPEALLEHLDWVRELAERLVGDPALADDLRQEAWLAATVSPPSRRVDLRAWLAGVVRNLARKEGRSAVRRRRREAQVARPEATAATDEVVGRVATQRRVVSCVLELEEPYRTTVLLRYHDQLLPHVIAARQGLPVATVKTRLRRGLAMLRARLADEHGGERSMCLALIAVVRGARPRSAAPSGLAALAGVAGALALATLALLGTGGERPATVRPSGRRPAAGALGVATPPARDDERVARASPEPVVDEPAAERGPWTPVLRGRALDLEYRGVPGLAFAFVPDPPVGGVGGAAGEPALTDAEGRFTVRVPPGRGRVALVPGPGAGEAWEAVLTPLVFPATGEAELVALVAPRGTLAGRVRAPGGAAVPHAELRYRLDLEPGLGRDLVVRRSALETWEARGDERGVFAFERVPLDPRATLHVHAVGYASRTIALDASAEAALDVELQPLAAGDVARGRVVDARGAPLAGAWVGAGGLGARTLADGGFQLGLDGRRPPVLLTAVAPGLGVAVGSWTDAAAGRARGLTLRVAEPVAWIAGRVVDPAGEPLAGVRVRRVAGTPFGRVPREASGLTSFEPADVEDLFCADPFHPWVETDGGGAFRLPALAGAPYELLATDLDTLARTRAPGIVPGPQPVTIVLAEEQRAEPFRCVVVGPDGEPLEGAYVTPFRPPLEGGSGLRRDYGARLVSDADGACAWPALVSADLRLHVRGPVGWFSHDFLPPAGHGNDVRLPVWREASLRVVLAEPGAADAFRVLDAAGRPLQLVSGLGEVSHFHTEGRVLAGGLSPTYGAPAQARELVLLRAGAEVARVPLELDPEAITVVEL